MAILTDLKIAKRIFFKRNSMPLHLTFFVTSRCNARCKMCFYWKELNKKPNELSLENIKKISSGMGDLIWLILTGGEPFMRKDLADIAEVFATQNNVRNITIPTNALLTKDIISQMRQMLKRCPNTFVNLIISIDGIGKDHDEIRGVPGAFTTLLKTYEEAKKLKSEYSNMGLSALITHSSHNQEKLDSIYEYLREKMEFDNISLNLVRGSPKDPSAKEIDISCYEKFNSQLDSDLKTGKLNFHKYRFSNIVLAKERLQRQMIAKTFREKKYLMPCYAGIMNAVITETGDLYPCEMLSTKFGNLKNANYNFKALWYSDAADKIRKNIQNTKCYCTHECFWSTNLLFNPFAYPKILKKIRLS